MHQTGIALLLGLVFGWIFWLFGIEVHFDDKIFFYGILPPIIFAAGYNMKRRRFFRNLGYIGLYGILGTIISFLIIGIGTFQVSQWDLVTNWNGHAEHITINEALALGSVLAASDVVAVLTIISEENQPRLHSILFGEGIVNDAIAIILFKSAAEVDFTHVDAELVLMFGANFLKNCVVSVILGTFFGLLSSWMLKKGKALSHEPVFETSAILFIAYIAYIVAEIVHLSGVITILACAIVMAHYTWYNCSIAAQHGTSLSFELIGHSSEAFVFAYLGMCAFTYGSIHWSVPFIFLTLLIVMIGRFVHVFIMSGLLKLCMRENFTVTVRE
jgi:NhaP-type Na+/H+ or K+/H+ antiporter